MQDDQDMEEWVFDTRAVMVELTLRCRRKIGEACSAGIVHHADVSEPSRIQVGAPLNEMM